MMFISNLGASDVIKCDIKSTLTMLFYRKLENGTLAFDS